jgi:molecular chaperone GrpE
MEEKLDIEKFKKDLAESEKKAEEYLNGWKRAKADLINFQKETEKRQREIIEFANANLILDLLPIHESLKKAVLHTETGDENLKKGIKQIKKQFDDLLKSLGIEEIKTLGEKFNPEFHESVGKKKEDGREEGIILEEVKAGYTMYGKVLEPAKVIVSE